MTDKQMLPYSTSAEASAEIAEDQDSYERQQASTLALDGQYRDAHVKRETQRRELREKAYQHGVAVCLGMAFYIGAMVLLVAFGNGNNFSPEAQVAIFATPVVAIAAITIFILRGVFTGFSEKSVSEDAQAITSFSNFGNGN